jgi:hypothetical protein
MPDKSIPELTAQSGLDGTEQFHIVDASGNSRRLTMADLKVFVNTDPSIVPSSQPFRGARAYRTTDATGVASGTAIVWQAEAYDTDGFWSVGAPTRITIPAGVTKVRLFWSVDYEVLTSAGTVGSFVRKNGTTLTAPDALGSSDARSGTIGANSNRSIGFTGVCSVASADYFELFASFDMANQDQVRAGSRSFFEIEVLEAT